MNCICQNLWSRMYNWVTHCSVHNLSCKREPSFIVWNIVVIGWTGNNVEEGQLNAQMDLVWWNSRKEFTLGKATVDVEFNNKVNLPWWNSQKELTLGKGSRVKVEFTLDLKLLQAAWSADTFVETGLGNFDNSLLSSISHVCHRHVHCHRHRHPHYDKHDHLSSSKLFAS